ncbi:MAG: homocysteine S-methyltransferase family protein, partial [Thermodesulfobacteriota bacterium]|nr:homocysteine S-methyltransferase family protein [Thermodesulfobacteriota bacterium]
MNLSTASFDKNDPATHSEVRKMAEFAKEALAAEIRFIGVCCGAGPHHIRSIAEALGRKPAASKYSPDMSKHYALGTGGRMKNDKGLGNNKLARNCAGFWFGYKARQWFHTGCMRPLTQRRSRAK